MIEDHYGHVNPVKNADRILMGCWVGTPLRPRLRSVLIVRPRLPRRAARGLRPTKQRATRAASSMRAHLLLSGRFHANSGTSDEFGAPLLDWHDEHPTAARGLEGASTA